MGSIGRPRQCNLTPHANAAYADWVALQSRLRTRDAVVVNGRDLTIADVVAVSL
jgi:phenylalanine ammonia-lyase